MKRAQIIKNQIRCRKCGELIESTGRHNFRWCACGACAVDGGHVYLRRIGNPEDWEEMAVVESREEVSDAE